MGSRSSRLLLVSRCLALQCPDSWTPTMAAADFCTVTTRIAAGRAVRLNDVCCQILRHAAGSSPRRWVLVSRWNQSGYRRRPVAPHAVQISPGKNANFLCTNAAFTVGVEPVGFAVMCQLASTPSALTMRFLSVISHICTRASSRPALAGQPLPSASG